MRVRAVAAWGGLVVGLALALTAGARGTAHAQTPLEQAEHQLAEADFAGALRSFDEAERTGPLDRAQLVRLYARRAIVHLALGDAESMEADLRRLASLDPGHTFGPEARPELRDGFERVSAAQGAALAVEVATEQQPGAVRLEATVTGDTAHLAQLVRVAARGDGGRWEVEEDGTLLLPATSGTVEYYAEVVGPGGAVLATDGSEAQPRSLAVTTSGAAAPSGAEPPVDGSGDDGSALGLWIGGGALVVAAIVGVVLLVVLSGNDATQPGAPAIYD